MKKLLLSQRLTDPNGRIVSEDSVGKILANAMMQSSQGDALKMFCLAQKLYEDKPFEVDDSDHKLLKDFANGQNGLINLAKARIIQALD